MVKRNTVRSPDEENESTASEDIKVCMACSFNFADNVPYPSSGGLLSNTRFLVDFIA
jgi:hypothetical protein